ncbi:desmoglein-2-like isoform X2 [Hemitrygon akajei]|uniref:desmoglein-2-like isoform X2 n=1 Tax=Hemitrygon akajei TaxID=2704970 RepID=UPI003BF957BE
MMVGAVGENRGDSPQLASRQGGAPRRFLKYFFCSLVQNVHNSTAGRSGVQQTESSTLPSMAWINPRQIFYFFLLTVCSQTGQCCKKMFAKHMFEAIVPPQLLKGDVVLKVIFYHCNFGEHIKLHTNDSNFGIHSDGRIYATHPLHIKSKYYFRVRAKDLRTHEKWRVPIQLMPFSNQSKTVLKNEHPRIYFRKANHFRRQKREWIIPPLDIREHEPPPDHSIGSIVSDIEQHEKLTYTITGPGADRPPVGLFVIDHRTGDLNITGEVDREKTPQFKLIGQAWNSRNQPVENPLELLIKVLDINDNPPEFIKEVFEGSVEELSPFGKLVMSLNATDKDEGENAQIYYRILYQGGKEVFVSNSNGQIKTLANDLDRETQDLYTLLVEARDQNGKAEGLSATANAQIRILDVNDNIPTAEKEEYEISVQENTLSDDVLRIKVIDKDQEFTDNWLGNFEIIEGNEDGHFRFEMDEQTNEGILILRKELDYEESSTRNLVLRVSNKAAYHASVSSAGGGLKPIKLKVNVKDQKEGFSFKPTKKRISVGENKKKFKVGQKLGKYPAISVDTGKESEGVRYAKGLDPANFFNIDPETSEITLVKVPDREADYIVDGKYTATVLAISNDGPKPKTSTGTVVIEVHDENDNIPIIKNLQPCMCDTAKALTITAQDLDSYPNGAPFTFKFDDVPEVADKWRILRRDDTSMELQPRHELWPGTFTVPLKVEDHQGSGKVQNVEVHVVECTSNSPTCSERANAVRGNSARLGAAAIGLMVFGALMLLLAPLLLLFCNSGLGGGIGGASGFKQIPIETFGTVENKNIEGGGERDTHMPLLPVSAATNATVVGTYPSEMDGRKGGAGTMHNVLPLNMNSSEVVYTYPVGNPAMLEGVDNQGDEYLISYMNPNMNMGVMENGRIGTMSEGALLDFMDSYISEKVDTQNFEDQTSPGHDTLLIYNYEGDGSLAGSIDSCNFIEGGFETGDSYLDNLDLKFKTLADICTGKLESQETTVSVDASVHQGIVKERSVSSSSMGLQAMNVIPDSTLMRKNYVVTTTINPVVDMVPLAANQAFDHQNIVVTNQVNTVPRRISFIENPNIAHQNIVMTKMVNGGAEVIPDMIIDPSIAHQNVIVTEQFSNRGNPAMIFNPSVTHHNAVVTNVVEGGAGGMQGMITQPHAVEKNVMVTKSIHKGDSQKTFSDSSLDHIPTIHKNVTLKKSAKSGMGEMQSGTLPDEAMVQKTRVSRRSVTSSDNNVHMSVTKVTKVAQVMQ